MLKKSLKNVVFSAIFFLGLLSVLPAQAKVMKLTPELLAKGKAAYMTNCTVCHGELGDGNGPAGAAMNPRPRNFAKDQFKKGDQPQQVFNTVSKGLEGTAMAGFGHLPEEDRWGLTYYVLSLRKAKK